MIKIHDNRETNERRLTDIELNGYFMFGDTLCRRVALAEEFEFYTEGIPFIEVPRGSVDILDRNIWVTPLRDEQINVSIEDWG